MAEEFKGVTVHFAGTVSVDKFPKANDIAVRSEGHLFVLNDTDAVAVYAPGRWANARVHD